MIIFNFVVAQDDFTDQKQHVHTRTNAEWNHCDILNSPKCQIEK